MKVAEGVEDSRKSGEEDHAEIRGFSDHCHDGRAEATPPNYKSVTENYSE